MLTMTIVGQMHGIYFKKKKPYFYKKPYRNTTRTSICVLIHYYILCVFLDRYLDIILFRNKRIDEENSTYYD